MMHSRSSIATDVPVTVCVFLVLVMFASAASAQGNVLFQEDFSSGFPIGWSTSDPSGNERLWSYCSDPTNENAASPGSTTGCHTIWDDLLNNQGPFAASTSGNGFMTVDSDAAGDIMHTSRLTTSAFDFSSNARVAIQFQSHIGVFTLDADPFAVLQVGTDGVNWTDFVVFPGLVTGAPNPPTQRWSFNPTLVSLDLTSVAAHEPVVFLRWQWTANFEFHWDLDDIVIYDGLLEIFSDGFESGDTSAWTSAF